MKKIYYLYGSLVLIALGIGAFALTGSDEIKDSDTSIPAANNTLDTVFAKAENGPKVVVNATTNVKVGDMIIVDASNSVGTGFNIQVIPEPPQLRVFNEGKIVCAGSGDKGITYLFIVSCTKDDKTDIQTFQVRVIGDPEQPDKPDKPGENLAAKVAQWCELVNSPTKREDALKLAQSFATISKVIEKGSFATLDDMMEITAKSNNEALGQNLQYWKPMLDSLINELKAMQQVGLLPDARAHAIAWQQISQGLQTYVATLPVEKA